VFCRTIRIFRFQITGDASLGEFAAVTPGLSGADLRNLVNETALPAAWRRQDEVRQKDFLDALEKIVLGPERPLLLSHADKERIAWTSRKILKTTGLPPAPALDNGQLPVQQKVTHQKKFSHKYKDMSR
jgi:ATP-dependent Zn protease